MIPKSVSVAAVAALALACTSAAVAGGADPLAAAKLQLLAKLATPEGGIDPSIAKAVALIQTASADKAPAEAAAAQRINGSGVFDATIAVTVKSAGVKTAQVYCELDASSFGSDGTAFGDSAKVLATVTNGKATCHPKLSISWPAVPADSTAYVSIYVWTLPPTDTSTFRQHYRVLDADAAVPTGGATQTYSAAVKL